MPSAFHFCHRCGLCGLIGGIAALSATLLAAEPVTVKTTSGRKFIAQVDASSSVARLWLRAERPGISLLRPLDWERVVEVTAGNQTFGGAEFRQLIETKRWPAATDPFVDSPVTPSPSDSENASQATRRNGSQTNTRLPAPSDGFPESPVADEIELAAYPVRTLHLEAYVANWDAGVEVDGIVLHVYPVDDLGRIVPIQGTIEVDLIGQNQLTTMTRGEPFPQLARWTQPVVPEGVGPAGAVFKLPFQAWHPEFDVELARLAVVHGRLTVPGQGVFDDTVGMVPIRPYSSTRDRLQQLRGVRFFPNEVTGRGQHITWPTP